MFKSKSYNTTNAGSSMNESSCAASRFARLSMDTVIAVSILLFAIIIMYFTELTLNVIASLLGIV